MHEDGMAVEDQDAAAADAADNQDEHDREEIDVCMEPVAAAAAAADERFE